MKIGLKTEYWLCSDTEKWKDRVSKLILMLSFFALINIVMSIITLTTEYIETVEARILLNAMPLLIGMMGILSENRTRIHPQQRGGENEDKNTPRK